MRQLKQMLNESQMCEYVEILFDIHEGLDNMIVSLILLISQKEDYSFSVYINISLFC